MRNVISINKLLYKSSADNHNLYTYYVSDYEDKIYKFNSRYGNIRVENMYNLEEVNLYIPSKYCLVRRYNNTRYNDVFNVVECTIDELMEKLL